MALSIGTPAPLFTLKSKSPEGVADVSLDKALKTGSVVLIFFPAAFSGVCTTELCTMSDDLANYDELNATVFGISVDMPYSLEGWAKAEGIKIQLLSDFSKATIKAYDVVFENFAGLGASVAQRAVFIIDKEGIIRYVEVTPSLGELPDLNSLKEALNSINQAFI